MTALLLLCSMLLGAQEARRPRILGVAHIGLYVSDIEKSRAFYKDLLGFGEPFWINNPDGSVMFTFIKVNEYQYIELFPGLKPDQDRLAHIALHTDDAEAMRLYLASRGFKVPDKVPKGRTGNSNFTVRDPDGHGVEFVQYEPDGMAMRTKEQFVGDERISSRMRHLGILAGDLEASAKFYRDVLGFTETWRGSVTGKVLSWVNMKVPDGDDYIELMLFDKLPAPDRRGSAHHICLETTDVPKSLEVLRARASRAEYSWPLEPRVGTNRKRQLNLFDPDGTRTELMEPVTVDGKPTPPSDAPPPKH
jgi:catechol 2,3-dioxygenase-like lactoylglutathione lyase family enzyme